MQRRVEEHLPVAKVAQLHAVLQRLVAAPGEVVPVDEAGRNQPEDLEELVDGVVAVQRLHVVGGQWNTVFSRQLGERGRPDRALEMAVQLGLGDRSKVSLVHRYHGLASSRLACRRARR